MKTLKKKRKLGEGKKCHKGDFGHLEMKVMMEMNNVIWCKKWTFFKAMFGWSLVMAMAKRKQGQALTVIGGGRR